MTNEPNAGHYFDAKPAVASKEFSIPLVLPDLTTSLFSDRGVFSNQALDSGTQYLLTEGPTPPPATNHALDLGCGYGPIARTLAHRLPNATIWAVDVNERAVDLTKRNTVDLNVHAMTPDEVPDDIRFDLIWSNPPIRIGKPALHPLLIRWLDRLQPAGLAILVVQKNLGSDSLARWLNEQGYPTERLKSRMGYRLLQVQAKDPSELAEQAESLPAEAIKGEQ